MAQLLEPCDDPLIGRYRRQDGADPERVPPLGLHDLRHSAAGLAFAALPLNEVSRLLRHANPRVTSTVYGGLGDDAAAAIGQKLAKAGFGA